MPYFTIVVPTISEENKDRFLEAWPTLKEELKSQPGVAGVSAGPVVAENGAAATEFKFVQCIGKWTRPSRYNTAANTCHSFQDRGGL